MSKKKVTVVDPPSGWKYGFPKVVDVPLSELNDAWYRRRGYPQHEIDKGMLKHCRWWEMEVDDE